MTDRMKFVPGKVLEELELDRHGRKIRVIFRYPKVSDVDQALKYINAVMVESEFLRMNKRLTRKEEKKWLEDAIAKMRQKRKIVVFAQINGKIAGSGTVESMEGASSHVGELGISLREQYTGMGIGTRFMELLMSEAIKTGIEVIKLSHYEGNERARRLYEKMGFIHVGVIPKARKQRGKYWGETIMYKVLV
jgi:RimJ/RimL family protein N-acetyltransferase